ncbi:MAG TPA: hypothetical protein VH703_06020 [Solirubrobacterales bacterium]|jgi:hypothetical protein
MSERLALLPLYARIFRTYFAWARLLLKLAVIVFVPIGLLGALPLSVEVDSLSLDSGLLIAGLLLATLALVATSLFGEVFYSGAIAISLTDEWAGGPPTLRELAGRIAYRRLIAVDLLYGLAVVIGLALAVVPGVLAYVWLGLAGPVVEIERRGVRAAFARSARLVHGRAWLVFAVLAPLELLSEGIGALADWLAQGLLGHSLWADWLAESGSNILATPFLAVACVLLTVGLIAEKDGTGPRLHSQPPRR